MFHLDDPEVWDWDNSLRATGPFGPLNVGTNAVLSAAIVKIPLWIKYEHLNEYKELRWNFRAMRKAEKVAMGLIEDVDMACAQDNDILYTIYLLTAIKKKEEIKKELREAYGTLEGACLESKYSAVFGSTMIEDIKWYIHITERNIYDYIEHL